MARTIHSIHSRDEKRTRMEYRVESICRVQYSVESTESVIVQNTSRVAVDLLIYYGPSKSMQEIVKNN